MFAKEKLPLANQGVFNSLNQLTKKMCNAMKVVIKSYSDVIMMKNVVKGTSAIFFCRVCVSKLYYHRAGI